MLNVLQSPARAPVRRDGDELICSVTGRRYPIINGTPHLYDEADISPFLRRDYAFFSAVAQAPVGFGGEELAAREAAYMRAKTVNTEFMFDLGYARRGRVLEMGVGNAGLIRRFGRMGFEAWALDFFTWEMEAARQDGAEFQPISAPMSRLPFKDGLFDIVYCHAALHHALPNDPAAFEWSNPRNLQDCLSEVRRVLAPDGVLFLLGEGLYPDDVQDRHYERICQADESQPYESWYTMADYEAAFAEAGMFPHVWADQENGVFRAHGYTRSGVRVPLVDLSAGITLDKYADLLPRIRAGLSAVLPDWVSPGPG